MAIDAKSLEILKGCLENNTSVIFSGSNVDIVFQTTILEVEKDFVALANRVAPEYIAAIAKSKNFILQSKMVRFSCAKIDTDGENILFPLNELKLIEETRQAERFPFDAEERVICELLNPFDNETILSKSVIDMSATGLSIRCAEQSELFKPNVYFSDIKVIIDGEAYTKSAARVVYHRKLMDENGKLRVQVGLKLE